MGIRDEYHIPKDIVGKRREVLREQIRLTMLANFFDIPFDVVASHFVAEALDVLHPTTNFKAKEVAQELATLTRVKKDLLSEDGRHYIPRWTDERKAHNTRTCARMWRPNKRTRDEMGKGMSEDELVILYDSLYPDRWSKKWKDKNKGKGKSPDPGPEVLVPRRVTFVSRGDAATAGGGPATEIKYLEPSERDKQYSASFCQNLTDSLSCKRVKAPFIEKNPRNPEWRFPRRFVGNFADGRLQESEYSHTMLVFAASVCDGQGPRAKAGIGLVTKDTVHYHEPEQRQPLMAAEREARLDQPPQAKAAGLFHLCDEALKKPDRGHNRELYHNVLFEPRSMVEACPLLGGTFGFVMERLGPPRYSELLGTLQGMASFGYIRCRSRPEWKSPTGKKDILEEYLNQRAWEEYDELAGVSDDLIRRERLGEIKARRDGDEDVTWRNVELIKEALKSNISHPGPARGPDNKGSGPKPKVEESATKEEPKVKAENPPKPKKQPPVPVTPHRADARALLAAVQLIPYNISHCTRLIIASNSEYAVEMATTRLGPALERGRPLRSNAGKHIEDEDI
jgi:hypothetical protein